MDYLLHRPTGFDLFTDHLNLKYIFNPASLRAAVSKYTAVQLVRWALHLMGYEYRIIDITSEANVWADQLSQWGNMKAVYTIHRVPVMVYPFQDPDFERPTLETMVASQLEHEAERLQLMARGFELVDDGASAGPWCRLDPRDGCRIAATVVCGSAFQFGWPPRGSEHVGAHDEVRMGSDTNGRAVFVSRCVHCVGAQGRLQRPYGEALHATKTNKILHWGYLSMVGGYILVMKDDASKYLLLHPTKTATALDSVNDLFSWFSLFGVVPQ